jgi:hypothetical protein
MRHGQCSKKVFVAPEIGAAKPSIKAVPAAAGRLWQAYPRLTFSASTFSCVFS